MSKQSIKIIVVIITISIMFGIFKNIFSNADTTQMKDIISKGAFLVDVRTPAEFAEGHVNGSVNIPLDQIAANLDKFKGKENIVVFCRSGNRSGQAKSILEQNGFANVTNGGTWLDINKILKN
jgi:rhodanese-related sulfurtransferase